MVEFTKSTHVLEKLWGVMVPLQHVANRGFRCEQIYSKPRTHDAKRANNTIYNHNGETQSHMVGQVCVEPAMAIIPAFSNCGTENQQ